MLFDEKENKTCCIWLLSSLDILNSSISSLLCIFILCKSVSLGSQFPTLLLEESHPIPAEIPILLLFPNRGCMEHFAHLLLLHTLAYCPLFLYLQRKHKKEKIYNTLQIPDGGGSLCKFILPPWTSPQAFSNAYEKNLLTSSLSTQKKEIL